uniref:Putative inorganic phosphate cotransporter n=1 Tax=Clastoptera arizonana TaxID=38151 RepID=A0A1B6DWX2_9HEMI
MGGRSKSIISTRYVQAIMGFFCMVMAYSLRINISVGIVAMTSNSTNADFPVLDWNTKTKGIILSSYFWGYSIAQIPSGILCQRFGPKYLLFGSLMICGIVTLLTPLAAVYGGWKIVIATRICQGLCQGCVLPCWNALISKWAPPLERGRIFSFVFGGAQFGTVFTLFIAGFLADSPGGWPSIFYVTGALSVAWASVWFFIGANSPAEHKSISAEEKEKIESLLVHNTASQKGMPTPWKAIFTSVPMWALIITHFCHGWGFWTMLTMIPTYMSSILKFDIKKNGLLSSMPYGCMWICTILVSRIADYINKKKLLSLNASRKMWNTIAYWGPTAGLIGLAMVNSDATAAMILLTITVTANATMYVGYLTNHLDLAPNLAGVLMGVTNGIANIASFLAPLTAGFILTDGNDVEEWHMVFHLAALVFFIGNLVFLIFGSVEVQEWNEPPGEKGTPMKTIKV